jgi:hypothetical protein
MFADLSPIVRHKIYETALCGGFKELRTLIEGAIGEERKMHESLSKYKREEKGQVSDYDKMLVQYHVDIMELRR